MLSVPAEVIAIQYAVFGDIEYGVENINSTRVAEAYTAIVLEETAPEVASTEPVGFEVDPKVPVCAHN